MLCMGRKCVNGETRAGWNSEIRIFGSGIARLFPVSYKYNGNLAIIHIGVGRLMVNRGWENCFWTDLPIIPPHMIDFACLEIFFSFIFVKSRRRIFLEKMKPPMRN